MMTYHGQSLVLELPKDVNNDIEVGYTLFTRAGEELASICASPWKDFGNM